MRILNTLTDDFAALSYMDRQHVYNGLDCAITHEICGKLLEQLTPDVEPIYNFERGLQAPALEMMLRGVLVDEEAKIQLIQELSDKAIKLDQILQTYSMACWDRGLNVNSPKQLQEFFYGLMGIPEVRVSFKGVSRVSTNREALEKVRAYYYAKPFVNLILAIRDLLKKLSVLRKGIDHDGRMRTAYNVAGTDTGRWSSSANAFHSGDNMQNQTEMVRHIYIADPGMKMCYADLEQAESRAVAGLSGDDKYWFACHGGDLHTTTAKLIWKKLPWTGDDKQDRLIADQNFYRQFSRRDMSKRGGHGSNYMGSPWTMAKHLKVPTELMVSFQQDYFGEFKGIPEWHKTVQRTIQTVGIMVTPLGRRRTFFGRRDSDEVLRAAVAFGPQSHVGDNLNLGLWLVWHLVPEVQILAQVHDAILFQYPEHLEHILVPRVLALMQVPIKVGNKILTIPSEASIGWNWGKFDPLKNPGGLKKFKPHDPDIRQRPESKKVNFLDRVFL